MSWVPDRLPELTPRNLQAPFADIETVNKLAKIAQRTHLNTTEITKRIVAFELMVAESEKEPYKIIEVNPTDLTENSLKLPIEGKGKVRVWRWGSLNFISTPDAWSFSIGRPMPHAILGSELGNYLMEMANRHRTTVEYIWDRMFYQGVEVAGHQLKQDRRYELREQGHESQALIIFPEAEESEEE